MTARLRTLRSSPLTSRFVLTVASCGICVLLMVPPAAAQQPAEDPPAAEQKSDQKPESQPPAEQGAEASKEKPPEEEQPVEKQPEAEKKSENPESDQPKQKEETEGDDSPAEKPKPEPKPEPKPKPKPKPKPEEPKRMTKLGASQSPELPGQPWVVHDYRRPRPPVIAPPKTDVIVPPPGDALVLFDGGDLSEWAHHDREDPAVFYEPRWTIGEGWFEVKRGTGDLFTVENFGDVQLHLEWASPAPARGKSQGRGNSGVKFLGLYEVQILDSFENRTYADGQAASIYGQYPPEVNVSRQPGEWQSYDIIFEMPRFEEDKLVSPGYLTVLHNGVLVHHRRELAGVTGMRSPGRYRPHPPGGPIMLQDHGNPVRFRNIWVRRLDR